jgi:hypothetical protein
MKAVARFLGSICYSIAVVGFIAIFVRAGIVQLLSSLPVLLASSVLGALWLGIFFKVGRWFNAYGES